MSRNRILIAILAVTAIAILSVTPALAEDPGSTNSGPALGKWEFTGKDNTGLVWTGTLSIEKLDPSRFDANRYHALCSLEVESTDPSKGTKGVEAPCTWDPRTRAISFTTGVNVTHLYTAILSSDGKTLSQGKWTESKGNSGEAGETVRSGNWSAKLPAR
jgi:hypothetical protein